LANYVFAAIFPFRDTCWLLTAVLWIMMPHSIVEGFGVTYHQILPAWRWRRYIHAKHW
jgi:hypothetical protein